MSDEPKGGSPPKTASIPTKPKGHSKGRRKPSQPSEPITGPLAAPPNPPKKKRPGNVGPRVGLTEKQQAKADRAKEWELNPRQHRCPYRIIKGKRHYIDNKQLIDDLLWLSAERSDPMIHLVALGLISDGFLDGKPAEVAKRMAFDLDEVAPFVADLVARELEISAKAGKPVSIREASEIVCARFKLPGNSPIAAATVVAKQYRKVRDNGRVLNNWQAGDTGGAWLIRPIEPGDFDLPDEVMEVPDDRFWRRRVHDQLVILCGYLPPDAVENSTTKNSEIENPDQTS
jgi:hypothetical protein